MHSELDIVNFACARIGADPVQSFSDELFGGQIAEAIYAPVVDFCLALHEFPFALEQVLLTPAAEPPLPGWTKVYVAPAGRVGDPVRVIASTGCPDRGTHRYQLVGERIHAEDEPLSALIRVRAHPSRWSPAFVEAVILALGAELALGLAADERRRDLLRRDAYGTPSEGYRGGAIGVAIAEARRATPARAVRLGAGPVVGAWRGGRPGWGLTT